MPLEYWQLSLAKPAVQKLLLLDYETPVQNGGDLSCLMACFV